MFTSSSEERDIANFVKKYGEFQDLVQQWKDAERQGNLNESSRLYLELYLSMSDKGWVVIG